jgi:hypothetical protein
MSRWHRLTENAGIPPLGNAGIPPLGIYKQIKASEISLVI